MSPREICAYLRWRRDALDAKPDDGDDVDFDTDGAGGWDGG